MSLLSTLGIIGGVGALDFLSGKALQDDAQDQAQDFARNAVRYRVADLKAAGLNPILAAGMGFGGAPTPGGAGAGGLNMAASVNSALNSAKLKKELDLLGEQTYATQLQGQKYAEDATLAKEMRTGWVLDNYLKKSKVPSWEEQYKFNQTAEGKKLAIWDRYAGEGSAATSALGVAKLGRGMLPKAPTLKRAGRSFLDKIGRFTK